MPGTKLHNQPTISLFVVPLLLLMILQQKENDTDLCGPRVTLDPAPFVLYKAVESDLETNLEFQHSPFRSVFPLCKYLPGYHQIHLKRKEIGFKESFHIK